MATPLVVSRYERDIERGGVQRVTETIYTSIDDGVQVVVDRRREMVDVDAALLELELSKTDLQNQMAAIDREIQTLRDVAAGSVKP